MLSRRGCLCRPFIAANVGHRKSWKTRVGWGILQFERIHRLRGLLFLCRRCFVFGRSCYSTRRLRDLLFLCRRCIIIPGVGCGLCRLILSLAFGTGLWLGTSVVFVPGVLCGEYPISRLWCRHFGAHRDCFERDWLRSRSLDTSVEVVRGDRPYHCLIKVQCLIKVRVLGRFCGGGEGWSSSPLSD